MGDPPRRSWHPRAQQARRWGADRRHGDRSRGRATTEPTLRDLSEALIAAYGTDYGVHSPDLDLHGSPTPRGRPRRTATGRVLLAGDAAHVHPPDGGQGLQTGVQDAVNLGWKLAQVVKGTSPDSLLDTYHAERHPVAARVLRTTMARSRCVATTNGPRPSRETVGELLAMDEPRRHFGAEMSGLDIRYDLGEGHPLLGRRMPDLDLVTADGPLRVFTLLHEARPVLLNLGEPGSVGHRAMGGPRPVWSRPRMRARGSCRRSVSCRLPRPSSFGPTGTWRGWARGVRWDLSTRSHSGSARRPRRSPGSYAGISPLDAFRAPSSRAVMTPPPMIATIPAT